ncbi:unnamed protein product [Schistosoma mattheei]|uniref:Uncharacterized protein n=1 Tax=Schistosoma mattheei TaxID=31246 RepID=A0AA85ASR2_9TREM|nr:unnamed protein product [Schistosoma mattheei]
MFSRAMKNDSSNLPFTKIQRNILVDNLNIQYLVVKSTDSASDFMSITFIQSTTSEIAFI